MNKKTLFAFVSVLPFALASCQVVKDFKEHLEDYVYEMGYHDDFNVLQLTDIHWNVNSSTSASKTYLEKLIAEVDFHIKETQGPSAKIDLVELTGDQFMLSNTYHVETFLKFMEDQASKYGFMYAAIWGNHDRHGIYNPNWLSAQFKNAKHCIYIEPEDNLYGRSNFVINLMDGDETKWQLANLDSGASFSETVISPFKEYDYIRKDQTEWWRLEHERVGAGVPTIAYYHIPQQDNGIAYETRDTRTHKFFKLEEFADNGLPEYASNFIKVGRENNLKAAFMGHAHNIDWTVDYDGVVLGLGVKTGSELYFAHIDPENEENDMKAVCQDLGITQKFDLIGASLVTIKNGTSFDLEHVYYNERASGDFRMWVHW